MIFSAGIYDIVIEFFRQIHPSRLKDLLIVANTMEFDEEGNIIGFKGSNIHAFTKTSVILEKEYPKVFSVVASRPNVILLGDNLHDLRMTSGLKESPIGAKEYHVLTIGFLNDRVEERLELFSENYDILILHDSSMEFVNTLVDFVLDPAL